jgi:hypothetical protein
MARKSALVVLVLAVACTAMLAVPTATATTEPAVTFFVHVRVTDRGIVFSCPACPGQKQFRRGWAAHFDVVNRGTKPYTVDIGGLRTAALRPGQKYRVSAFFDERGRFPFKVVGSPAAGHKGWLRVI